jgi:hypothetical protein
MSDQFDNYTYVVSVRETVDTQYIVRVPEALTEEAISNLDNSLDTLKMLGQCAEARLTRNIREREIHDVTFTGRQLKQR